MRHLIPLAACTVAVAALVPTAIVAHHNAIHQLTVQNARTAAQQAKAKVQAELAAHKQAEATQAKLDKLQKNCQSGLAAYNLLTAPQKKSAVKPDCGV